MNDERDEDETKKVGTFLVANKSLTGTLTLAARNTNLFVYDNEWFGTHAIPNRCVTGILHDFTRVTLLNCITQPVPGSRSNQRERNHFANIFPHFVVLGDKHISPIDKTITQIHFVIDDAASLFYDFDAFSSLIDAEPYIHDIAKANWERLTPENQRSRPVTTGPYPEILYFTGKSEIIAAETVLGRVTVNHRPISSWGGPEGIWLKNTIWTTIEFPEPTIFDDAIESLLILLKFFELIIGRPQTILATRINIVSDNDQPVGFDVHWSMPPERKTSERNRNPQPSDLLLNGGMEPEVFSEILSSYLQRNVTWGDARSRFSTCFSKQNYFDIDRLIAAANMFDVLPASAFPAEIELSPPLRSAKEASQIAFQRLLQSPERDSILSALGRLGKASLKQKIRHRATPIIEAAGNKFPELVTITDEAVNCRNHYVHGSESNISYNENFWVVNFLIRSLEFVFASSDLIEAGWDIKVWLSRAGTASHPFSTYWIDYEQKLREFKNLTARHPR